MFHKHLRRYSIALVIEEMRANTYQYKIHKIKMSDNTKYK